MARRDPTAGLLAEFESPESLAEAIEQLREEGFRELAAFSPYDEASVQEALDLPGSKLPRAAFLGGLLGGAGAYLGQWWIQVVDYPLNIGGRDLHAAPAYIPITFELTVLFAALAAFLGWLFVCRLPRLWHPLFEVEGFERASIDRYFLAVSRDDPLFDRGALETRLGTLKAVHVRPFGEEASA